jgi:hypothetical protein
MRGRAGDDWQRVLARRPLPERLRHAALAGFSAVYVNRDGFPGHGQAIERELTSLLGEEPLASANRRFLVYRLVPHGVANRARSSGGNP